MQCMTGTLICAKHCIELHCILDSLRCVQRVSQRHFIFICSAANQWVETWVLQIFSHLLLLSFLSVYMKH